MTKKKKPEPMCKTNMTVSIDKVYHNYLKRLSYRLSADEDKKIGLSEVVRRALESYCPIPPSPLTMEEVSDGSPVD